MSGQRASGRGYARTARVNEVLRQVLADHLERMEELDERLGMLTITAVQCDPDLRHATVLVASMSEEEAEALEAGRVRLQAAISSQMRLKRTPQLRFAADPAVAAGQRIEEILRGLEERPAWGRAPHASEDTGGRLGGRAGGRPAGLDD